MSEMVERVAETIWRADPSHTPMKWSECVEEFREVKRKQARAAIEAMRELSDNVHKAMCDAHNSPAAMWNAAIDEMLK